MVLSLNELLRCLKRIFSHFGGKPFFVGVEGDLMTEHFCNKISTIHRMNCHGAIGIASGAIEWPWWPTGGSV
jgi:lipid A disaccharide synthetase